MTAIDALVEATKSGAVLWEKRAVDRDRFNARVGDVDLVLEIGMSGGTVDDRYQEVLSIGGVKYLLVYNSGPSQLTCAVKHQLRQGSDSEVADALNRLGKALDAGGLTC